MATERRAMPTDQSPVCNRRACQKPLPEPRWWNTLTRAYYCGRCKRAISRSADDAHLFEDHRPTATEAMTDAAPMTLEEAVARYDDPEGRSTSEEYADALGVILAHARATLAQRREVSVHVDAVASVLRWLATPRGPHTTHRDVFPRHPLGPVDRPDHSAVLQEYPNGVVEVITGNRGVQRYRTFGSFEELAQRLLVDVQEGVTEWPHEKHAITDEDVSDQIREVRSMAAWADDDSETMRIANRTLVMLHDYLRVRVERRAARTTAAPTEGGTTDGEQSKGTAAQ